MTTLNPANPGAAYQKLAEDRYWRVVEASLVELCADRETRSEPVLLRRLADFRIALAAADPLEQALTLHAEPLDVALDLAGMHPEPRLVERYRMLLKRLG